MPNGKIHAIVYRNIAGHKFTNRTPGFPTEHEPDIKAICNCLQGPKDGTPSLRYQRLAENVFLFSVIRHYPQGTPQEKRPHNGSVHFLMDPNTAYSFFQIPFRVTAEHAVKQADIFLTLQKGVNLPDTEFPDPMSTPKMEGNRDAALIAAAEACFMLNRSPVLLPYSALDPYANMEDLIWELPPRLRRNLSFQINPHEDMNDSAVRIRIRPTGSGIAAEEVPNPGKLYRDMLNISSSIPLYHRLKYCITDWNEYLALGELVNKKPTLREALEVFPDEKLSKKIDWLKNYLDADELQQIIAAAVKRPLTKEAARAVLKEKETNVNAVSDTRRSFRWPRLSLGRYVPGVLNLPMIILLLILNALLSTALILSHASPHWSLAILPAGLLAGYLIHVLKTE